MVDVRSRRLTRKQIGEFIPSARGVLAFEEVQTDVTTNFDEIANASFLTLGSEPGLGSERVFGPVSGDLVATDGGANGVYTLGLAETGVGQGTYGDATHYPVFEVDAKGRITSASTVAGGGGGGSGTVTSVALSMPAIFTVTGSPVTTAGTLTASLASQSANLVLASPNGAAGAPTFRALVAADVPTLNQNTTGSAATLTTGRTIGMTGDVVWTSPSFDGSANVTGTATIGSGAVTLGKMANLAANSFIGNNTGAGATPIAMTVAQSLALITSTSGGGTTNFLRADGTWAAPAGGSSLAGLATVTVPNGSNEWEETVTATGVTGTSKVILGLAPAADTEENDPIMLDVRSMSATPGTNQITVYMAFGIPASGAIKLNWSAF